MHRYNENKRTICPHCKGDKRVLKPDRESETPFEACPVCLGEGIVIKQVIIKPII